MFSNQNQFSFSYLEPDRSKQGKRKTNVVKNNLNPSWNYQLSYGNVTVKSLKERCLELTVWDYDTIGSNDFLGGVRLGMGTGEFWESNKERSCKKHQYTRCSEKKVDCS